MKRGWMLAAVVVHATVPGCGAIVEVPVASTSESSGTSGTGEASDERGTETAADSTAGETEPPDIDDASSSGTTGGSSGGEDGPPQAQPFCHQSARGVELPEDGSWLAAAIEVPALEGASTLAVSLRLAHPRVSDLRVRLRAPDGSATSLLDEPACDQANIDAWFEDGAAQLGNALCMTDGIAAIRGPVAALDELAPLLRAPVGGSWALELADAVPGERGTLDQGCVVLTVEGR